MKITCYTMPRAFGGYKIPISMQTLLIRQYCADTGLQFTLPITEMCLPHCFPVFTNILRDAVVDTVVVCSLSVFSEFILSSSVHLLLARERLTIHCALTRSQTDITQLYQGLQTILSIHNMQNQIAKQLLDSHDDVFSL